MDEYVEKVLDMAFVTLRVSPESSEKMNFVARRYLEHLQGSQKKQAEQICKNAKRTVPKYTFDDTHQDQQDGMEF